MQDNTQCLSTPHCDIAQRIRTRWLIIIISRKSPRSLICSLFLFLDSKATALNPCWAKYYEGNAIKKFCTHPQFRVSVLILRARYPWYPFLNFTFNSLLMSSSSSSKFDVSAIFAFAKVLKTQFGIFIFKYSGIAV